MLTFVIASCKGGKEISNADKGKKEVELILQMRKAAEINLICQSHTEVGLRSIKVLSARMGTWLVSVLSSSDEMTEEIMKTLKMDVDIVNIQLNHKNVEQRDGGQ